jgi:cyclopropane-fatty-acyl-phospholipid synthase
MSYSSALFGTDPQQSLQQAQRQKYLRLLQTLDPKPGDTILEIGCGWGGLAEIAATEFGCRVHGITLSPSQLAWSQARAQQKGFADLADFSLTDYRDVRGQYDHIVSIEMFEAVGERFWPGYFAQLHKCLKPGGRAAVQTITIANERFAAYRRGTDFIQRHIFPGGMLPSPEVFERRAAGADFSVLDRHAFGIDYARTLAHWHRDSRPPGRRFRRRGSTSASAACGASTSPTAKPASVPAPPTSITSCCKNRAHDARSHVIPAHAGIQSAAVSGSRVKPGMTR